MKLSPRLAALLVLAPLAACATQSPTNELKLQAAAPAPVAKEAAAPINPDASLEGLYLAGNAASKDGHNDAAADYFARAASMVEDAGAPFLKEKAFLAAVSAGEIDRAATIAPNANDTTSTQVQRLGRLVVAVDDLAKGLGPASHAILKTDDVGPPYRQAALLLRPWAAAAAGDVDPVATIRVEGRGGDRLSQAFTQLNRALILEHVKRYDDAQNAYEALLTSGVGMRMFHMSYGAFLERRGKKADAIALYDRLLTDQPDDRAAQVAKARAGGRSAAPPKELTVQEAASQALLTAATSAMAQSSPENALIYLQLSLRLDPDRPEPLLLAGGFAEQRGDYEEARDYYARVPATAPEFLDARGRIALTYQAEDQDQKALEFARETARIAPNDRDAQVQYADFLRANGDNEGAVKVLTKVINTKGRAPDWRLLYARAVAAEHAGRWRDAEKDLQRAVEIAPDEPDILNYLGYSWADRGEHLEEAMALLEKAARAQPNSGAIIDSLGWAYFRKGDVNKAVEFLERAVELSPADADINDHLGDAYYRAPGRRLEALYQWERVLTLRPDEELKKAVQAKITQELEATAKVATAKEPAAQ